jgi:hypothetical protein
MPQFPQHGTPAATAMAGIGAVPQDFGYAAWTQDPATQSPNAGAAGVAGTLQLRRLAVPGIQQITAVTIMTLVAAVGGTSFQNFLGVWDGNGVLVGITADVTAGAFNGVAQFTVPLNPSSANGPPFLVDTPYIYVGHWWNAGTSGPQLARGVINGDSNGVGAAQSTPQIPTAQATSVTANTGLTTAATVPTKLGALTRAPASCNWYAIS